MKEVKSIEMSPLALPQAEFEKFKLKSLPSCRESIKPLSVYTNSQRGTLNADPEVGLRPGVGNEKLLSPRIT